MADLLQLTVLGDRHLLRNLEQMPDTVRAILLEKTRALTEEMADKVRANIEGRLNKTQNKPKGYSGSPTHMKDAVKVQIVDDGIRVDGQVYIEGIPYARAQEEGAVVPPHMIYPKKAKVLAFMAATGDKVFATRVFHPGGMIPPSWFMKDAYRELSPRVGRDVRNAVVQGIRARMRAGR